MRIFSERCPVVVKPKMRVGASSVALSGKLVGHLSHFQRFCMGTIDDAYEFKLPAWLRIRRPSNLTEIRYEQAT